MEEVEQLRKKYWTKYSEERTWMWIICAVLTFGGAFVFGSGVIVIFIMSLTIGWAIVYWRSSKELGEYRAAYKEHFVQGSLERVFPGCQYYHDRGLNSGKIAETGMMNTGDRYSSEDLVLGEYKGVKFEQADVEVEEEHTDDDGNRTYVTVFLGRYVIFDIKKKFDFRLAIIGKRFGARQLRNRDKIKKFSKREVESGEFHKRFTVYAEDGFEAFYLLDPALIERVEKLGETYNNQVAIFFYKGFMHVAVGDGSDSFKVPKGNKPIDEAKEFEKVEKDMRVITDLVDGLKIIGE